MLKGGIHFYLDLIEIASAISFTSHFCPNISCPSSTSTASPFFFLLLHVYPLQLSFSTSSSLYWLEGTIAQVLTHNIS